MGLFRKRKPTPEPSWFPKDVFGESVTVDQMIREGGKPLVNTDYRRGIEFFDRMSGEFDLDLLSEVVTGYATCGSSPLDVLHSAVHTWETKAVGHLDPWYLRTDFQPPRLNRPPSVQGLRRLEKGVKRSARFGHETPYDGDPFPESVPAKNFALGTAGLVSPTTHLTTLAVDVPHDISMNLVLAGSRTDDVRVDQSRMVLAPTVKVLNKEIKWSFFAGVYSWRTFELVRVSSCSVTSQQVLRDMCVPVVKLWASVLQDAADPSHARGAQAPSEMKWIQPGTRL